MSEIIRRDVVSVDLDKPLKPERYGGVLATFDNASDAFCVKLFRNGKAVAADGCKVTGYFTRSDGVTQKLTGSVDGNMATVTLDEACYLVPGRFKLSIMITRNNVLQTVRLINGFVYASIPNDMWKDVRISRLEQIAEGTVIIGFVPNVDVGMYLVHEVINGEYVIVTFAANETSVVLHGVTAGEHAYSVQPMNGGQPGNHSAISRINVVAGVTVYSVANKLTNVTNENNQTTILKGYSYHANLTADSGYEIDSVVVTMGGVDVTADVYADGVINFNGVAVTGDIVITASAVEKEEPDEPIIPDEPDEPDTPVDPGDGTVTLTVEDTGAAVLTGATLTVDSDGNGTLTGATLTVNSSGAATVA